MLALRHPSAEQGSARRPCRPRRGTEVLTTWTERVAKVNINIESRSEVQWKLCKTDAEMPRQMALRQMVQRRLLFSFVRLSDDPYLASGV